MDSHIITDSKGRVRIYFGKINDFCDVSVGNQRLMFESWFHYYKNVFLIFENVTDKFLPKAEFFS